MKRHGRQDITFAELYQKNISALSRARSFASGIDLDLNLDLSFTPKESLDVESCHRELNRFALSLENDNVSSLSRMKSLVNILPTHLERSFVTWVDSRGMDVLQLCIVFNKPEIIWFLLEHKDLFPEGYEPVSNPYAHLAATLGHKDCLKAILTHRPSFYFKCTQPRHAVKLHKDIQARLRITEAGGVPNRQVQKMLKKVTSEAMKAERAAETAQRKTEFEIVDVLDRETVDFKEPKPITKRRPTLRSSSLYTFSSEKRRPSRSMANKVNVQGNIKEKSVKCEQLRKTKDHVITVYQDILQNETDGVLRGAGPAVRIVYGHEKDTPEEQATLSSMYDVRTLSQNSRSNVIHRSRPLESGFNSKSKVDFEGKSSFSLNVSNSAVSTGLKSPGSSRLASKFKKIEIGVRTIKRYKDFQIDIQSRMLQFGDDKPYMNKTPLSIAAERGHLDCVIYILQTFVLRKNPRLTSNDPLTMATIARSPESIAILLTSKHSRADFQGAVLTALREFYPACLTVLLNGTDRGRAALFDGQNLLHMFYTQSLNADYKYEMMPQMTRTLIECKEYVNSRGAGSSHPMYTLISCAFNIKAGKQFLHYLECLKILLDARANPHYNEIKDCPVSLRKSQNLSRQPYYSAIHCIFDSATRSTKFFEKSSWSKIIMQKFIDCIVVHDKTPRRTLNDVLFDYMDHVCELGLDRRVIKSLLRYGANPDFKYEDAYAINKFFDLMLPFLTKFEVGHEEETVFEALLMICQSMSPECLHEAFVLFLDEHLFCTPLQGLSLTRRFCYEVNKEVRSPRSLVRLTAQFIWKKLQYNNLNVKKLPIDTEIMNLIVPFQGI